MGRPEIVRRTAVFTDPHTVAVIEEPIPKPGPGEILVRTLVSAISPGTEMLVYRGQVPQDIPLDATITGLQETVHYPLRYGYAAVGRVESLGQGVEVHWLDRLVFAFQPHTSHFTASPDDLLIVPEGITTEQAAFLPNTETAVTFVLDGAPLLGERVAVFGQGIVGLLTTALLAEFPLEQLVTVDAYEQRRQASLAVGADESLPPDVVTGLANCDLTYELSGNPAALNAAIQATGYSGRLVIGSWYGEKPSTLDLGGHFHRSRMQLISSQVSSIAPGLRGRWSKERRFAAAWDAIRRIGPERFITQRIPITRAADAYRLIDERTAETIQVAFIYD